MQCPVCGKEGTLEVRGGSQRVIHCEGRRDGKLLLVRHLIGKQSGKNGKQEKADLRFFNVNAGGVGFTICRDVLFLSMKRVSVLRNSLTDSL